MTVRSWISTITNSIRQIDQDSWVSPKLVYNLSTQVIGDFLKKENSASKLTFKLTSGWTSIPNIPMESVPTSECNLGINQCQKLMRSKYPLPAIYESKFGAIIKYVMSLNYGTNYTFIASPKQWIATTKRQYGNERYFFFIDNYLYIPIRKGDLESPENVKIEAYSKDKWETVQFINKINQSCEDCKIPVDVCKSRLEYEMVIPFSLENEVKKEVIQSFAQIYLKITPDELPNTNVNEKTNPTNI